MEAVLQTNIFFFITSVSVIIITVLLVVIGFYVLRIVKNVSEISTIIKDATSNANEKLSEVIDQYVKLNPLYRLIFGKIKKTRSEKKTK